MKFHINDEGRAMPCSAQINCRFGSEDSLGHYPTKEDAEKAYERHMTISLTDSLSGKRKSSVKSAITYEPLSPTNRKSKRIYFVTGETEIETYLRWK